VARQRPEPQVPRPESGDTVNLAIRDSQINLLLAPPEPRAARRDLPA